MSELLHALQAHAGKTPYSPAVIGSHMVLSYRALYDEVITLSGVLHTSYSIGLFMQNSPAWIVADLAIMHAGVMNIPLPTFFSDEQLIHAVNDAVIDTIVTDNASRFESLLPVIQTQSVQIAGSTYQLLRVAQPESRPQKPLTSKVTYTSGSTGKPRGVQLSVNTIETVAGSLRDASNANTDDRALVLSPLSTLLENIGSVYTPILAGAQIIVPNPLNLGLFGSSQVDAQKLANALQYYRPTTAILSPQLLKLVIGLARQRMLPGSFRYIAVGGAPVGRQLLEEAQSLNLPVFQGYGLSEACSVVAVNTQQDNRPGSVGKPLPHVRVRISEQGEVIVRGSTFDGYLNDVAQGSPEELETGDLGYIDDDGYLYVNGRRRNVIITSYGRNISPEWVESELQSQPLISQAAVVGNDREYLVAVLAPSASEPHAQLLKGLDDAVAQVNRNLPDYAQVAEYVIADKPFRFDLGELTTNGRPRHEMIERHYSDQIEKLYVKAHEQVL